ncbi:MAG: hypothetical protein CL840_08300 [Crocinitomicaceae bacterium]|nr:hypothetical protein [Crocinitomicaceae bacterium]|tara:strand:- start:11922 stop:13106 length:1185 start_codon:yes stop_codon:yes gene_type:complete
MKKFVFLGLLTLIIHSSGIAQEKGYITNKDYREFVEYVKDSLIRVKICEKVDRSYCVYSSDGSIVAIDRKKKYKLTSDLIRHAYYPLLYSPYEQINGKEEFDTRKLIINNVPIYPKEYIWWEDTTLNKTWTNFLSIHYFTHVGFQDFPVYGITNLQLNEYLKWKYPNQRVKSTRHKHQLQLKSRKELLNFTNAEYYQFYLYTRDSIVRRIAGEEVNEEEFLIFMNQFEEDLDPPHLYWKSKINWSDTALTNALVRNNILTADGKIYNPLIIFENRYIDYHHGIRSGLEEDRSVLQIITQMVVHIGDTISPILDKSKLNDRSLAELSQFEPVQLHSFYYWRNRNYPHKDVYRWLIPYFKGFDDQLDDMERLRSGELEDSFFRFEYSIPAITIKPE